MMRAYRYPLRPTKAQAATLTSWLGVCCDLYNAALQERRDAWRIAKKAITRFDQTRDLAEARSGDPVLASVPSEIERSALRRVDLAFKAFFRRCQSGERPGYPQFRSRRRYDSLSFSIPRIAGDRVVVPKLGTVRFHRYRNLGGPVSQATLGRDPAGKWWILFWCELGGAPAKVEVRTAVGIDLGLTTFATMSDGSEVENPRWARAGAARMKRCQQALCRRKRGSASRERARLALARAHAHVANQRKDFARKLACDLFRRYDLVAYEDLAVKQMARGHFAKSISDVGWGTFLQAVVSKAERTGRHAVAVNPSGTTQRCSGCGVAVEKGLSDRRHVCRCGVDLGRDHNAALNILALGRSAVETEKPSVVEAKGPNVAHDPWADFESGRVERAVARSTQKQTKLSCLVIAEIRSQLMSARGPTGRIRRGFAKALAATHGVSRSTITLYGKGAAGWTELDGVDLKRRVKSMARRPGERPVDPKLGTDE